MTVRRETSSEPRPERAAAAAHLSGYGYRDEARTRARIPIGRAMDLTVGRSLEPAEPAAR